MVCNQDGSTYGYHSVLTATIYGQHVGGFLEVATASGIDDDQHTPTATAAHTARYDLQAGMAAGAIRNGDQAAPVAAG